MTKHFCCCISLKTGATVMAFLTILEGMLEIIISSVGFTSLEPIKRLENTTSNMTANVFKHVCHMADSACNKTGFGQKVVEVEHKGYEGYMTLFTVCIILGIASVGIGVVLVLGIIQAKEKYILWYVFLSSVNLFIVTVYTGINMFTNIALIVLFFISVFMWYGQFAVYNFYEEVAEYNEVKAGVIEISYNGDAKSYANSMVQYDGQVDNTAV